MDAEQKRKQILGTVRTIAMAAMQLQPDERQGFIERTTAMIRRNYEKTHGADPDVTDVWSNLLDLTKEMVRNLEESGGTTGHA